MARQKTILGAQMPHAWAHQTQEYGAYDSRRNFYFRGRTIYSYGSHFPIATIDAKDSNLVWFTLKTFSNTTAQHISDARGAVSDKRLVYVQNVPIHEGDTKYRSWQQAQIAYFMEQINEGILPLLKAIKPSSHIRNIQTQQHYLQAFITQLRIRTTKAIRAALADPMSAEFTLICEANREEIAKRLAREPELDVRHAERMAIKDAARAARWAQQSFDREEYQKNMRLSEPERLAKWRAGENVRCPGSDGMTTLLRLHNGQIETSKGIRVPLPVAERYYHTVLRALAKELDTADCGIKMMEFCVKEITSDHLLVGCHDIPMSEIEEIATLLGWNKDNKAAA